VDEAFDDERADLVDLAAFVNALNEIAGFPSSAAWARAAGYYEPNLSKLRNGKGGADGLSLLRLIRAAADRAEIDESQIAVRAAIASDRLAVLEAKVEETAGKTADSLLALERAVEQGIARIEKRLPREDGPTRKSGT
jgi:hypothetical protein